MPGLPVHHQFLELAQTHIHWVGDAIQPSRPLLSLSPPPSIFPSIRVFSRVSSSHQVAKVLEFQLQHQSFRGLDMNWFIIFANSPQLWLPWWLSSKESPCRRLSVQETWVWCLGWGDPLEKKVQPTPGEWVGKCLGNPMDREDWQVIVHGVVKSQTQLSNWTTTSALLFSGAIILQECWSHNFDYDSRHILHSDATYTFTNTNWNTSFKK